MFSNTPASLRPSRAWIPGLQANQGLARLAPLATPFRPSRAQNRQLQMLGIQRHLSAESTLHITSMQENMCVPEVSYELNQKTIIEKLKPKQLRDPFVDDISGDAG
jgi:hypothetical protein